MSADARELLRGQLLREKRLLLLVSAILVAHQWLGIQVTNSVESLGFHFEITNPTRLWSGVWVVWGWALLRYMQLLYSFSPRKDFPQLRYLAVRRALCDRIIARQVRREAKAVFSDVPHAQRIGVVDVTNLGRYDPAATPGASAARSAKRGLISYTWLRFNIVRSVRYNPSDPQPHLEQITEKPRTRGDVVAWQRTGGGESAHESEGRYDVTDAVEVPVVTTEQRRVVRALAWLWTVIATSYGTEHYVPLSIGLAPLLGLCLGLPVTLPQRWCCRVLPFGPGA